jgi:hypothetical protein
MGAWTVRQRTQNDVQRKVIFLRTFKVRHRVFKDLTLVTRRGAARRAHGTGHQRFHNILAYWAGPHSCRKLRWSSDPSRMACIWSWQLQMTEITRRSI